MAIALAAIPVALAGATGISPGSFAYKLHDTVPLRVIQEEFPPFERTADVAGLFSAPAATQAGAHADVSVMSALKVSSTEAALDGTEVPQETVTELPPGLITNLGEVAPCSHLEFVNTVSGRDGGCPTTSQVGVMSILYGGALTDRTYPLYKLSAAHDHLVTFGFPYELIFQPVGILLNADLRAEGNYGITFSSSQISLDKFVPAPFMTIWGIPAQSVHDQERWNPETLAWGDSLDGPQVPLIANATDCNAGTLEARQRLRYWAAPDRWLPEDPEDLAYRSFVPAPEGCDRLSFAPQAELLPSSGTADTPAGIDLRLQLPRDPAGLETPPLQGATLTLPEGMSVNPATADGLMGCTPEQIGLEGDRSSQSGPLRFSAVAPSCPPAAKVGDAEVKTPVSEEPLRGDIYFATPFRNPFHSLLALYLVLEGPGFTSKLAVDVEAEPGSGRLKASIESLPQLPIESAKLSLAAGPRAPLAPPPGCGEGSVELQLTPWSAPQSGPPARIVSRYTYSSAPQGIGCAGRQESPRLGFQAGSRDAAAGRPSAFVLHLERDDLGAFEIKLPSGFAVQLREVEQCGEADIERARARQGPGEGATERSDPSCPASSRVGSLLVGAGPGPVPLFTPGNIYFAGPYRGAPFSLVAITPALAGGTASDPLFDLGTIVNRVALTVNRRSGALNASVDAPPRTLDGIPLRIWRLDVVLDRPGFTHNPSNCRGTTVSAEVEGADRSQSMLQAGFRATSCGSLGFSPSLRLAVVRGRRLSQHPTVRATLRARASEAGIAGAHLGLPASELLDSSRLRSSCHAVPLRPGDCPRDSLRGRAVASSGLIDGHLEGPVYLRSSDHGSPQLVVALGGQPELELIGRVRLRGRRVWIDFSKLPDLQLRKLVVTLWGGRRGFLTNAGDLCGPTDDVTALLVSQGGTIRARAVPFGGSCGSAEGRSQRTGRIAKRMEE